MFMIILKTAIASPLSAALNCVTTAGCGSVGSIARKPASAMCSNTVSVP